MSMWEPLLSETRKADLAVLAFGVSAWVAFALIPVALVVWAFYGYIAGSAVLWLAVIIGVGIGGVALQVHMKYSEE